MQDRLLYALAKSAESKADKKPLAAYFYNLYAVKALADKVLITDDINKEELNAAFDSLDDMLQRGRAQSDALPMHNIQDINEYEAIVYSDMEVQFPTSSPNLLEREPERMVPMGKLDTWRFETDYQLQRLYRKCFPIENARLVLPKTSEAFRRMQKMTRLLQRSILRRVSLAQISKYIRETPWQKINMIALATTLDVWDRRLIAKVQCSGEESNMIAKRHLQHCLDLQDVVYAFFRDPARERDCIQGLLIPLSLHFLAIGNFDLAAVSMDALRKRPEVLDLPVDFVKRSELLLGSCERAEDYVTLCAGSREVKSVVLPVPKFKHQPDVTDYGLEADVFHEHWFFGQAFDASTLQDKPQRPNIRGTELHVKTPAFTEPAPYDPNSYGLFVNDLASYRN